MHVGGFILKRLRVAAVAAVLVSSSVLFQNCSGGAKSASGTAQGSSNSTATRFQTTTTNGVTCSMQPTTSTTLLSVAATTGIAVFTDMDTLDVGACGAYCEATGAAYCELFQITSAARPYRCLSFNKPIDQIPNGPRGPATNPQGLNFIYFASCSGVPTNLPGTPTSSPLLDPKVFNASDYLARHADLRSVFGNDVAAAQQHWLNYGLAEGRQGNATFLASAYLARYADLRAAFGNDYKKAAEHFVQSGAAEGRSGAPAAAVVTQPTQPQPQQPQQPSADSLVRQAYLDILGRQPDSAGLAQFVGYLNSGYSISQVRALISASPEAIVRRAYRDLLFREPDSTGGPYWAAQVAAGVTESQLRATLMQSAEYRSLH